MVLPLGVGGDDQILEIAAVGQALEQTVALRGPRLFFSRLIDQPPVHHAAAKQIVEVIAFERRR